MRTPEGAVPLGPIRAMASGMAGMASSSLVLAKLYDLLGDNDYVGEPVSLTQHALQSAFHARRVGLDDDVVLAALLHDVGHVVGLRDTLAQMENVGTWNHEAVGAQFLASLGLSKKTCELVERHVDAKRWLVGRDEVYLSRLTDASKTTLRHQGGAMTNHEERRLFEASECFRDALRLRRIDELAKDTHGEAHDRAERDGFEAYVAMIDDAVARAKGAGTSGGAESAPLCEDDVQAFEKDGFVLKRGFFDESETAQLRRWISDLERTTPAAGRHMVYYEGDTSADARMICRTENFLPFHVGLRKLLTGSDVKGDASDEVEAVLQGVDELSETRRGRLANAVEQLLGERCVVFKEKVNYKLVGGGGFPAHQDAPAYAAFGQRRHLTALIAVDDMTVSNGCLEIARGEHTRGVLAQHPVHRGVADDVAATLDFEHVTMRPGDVLLFHSMLPHRSGPNVSSHARRALYITYNGTSDGDFRSQYYAEKRARFPQSCERVAGVDYSEGAKVYNLATPITS